MYANRKITLLLNWDANPYHCPIFVAKSLGFDHDAGFELAIFTPTDPSDVTEAAGHGSVDFALKAMLHTIAGRAKGYPLTSIATLLDEPPTGLIALKSRGINSFHDIKGKRLGYVGEFGKKIIDNLAAHAGIQPEEYQTIRVGMNIVDHLCRNVIDAGIGFINFQKIELEALFPDVVFLRIDQLAGLGCCCFCSVQYITTDYMIQNHPNWVKDFLQTMHRAVAFTTEQPEQAYEILCESQPRLRNPVAKKIFDRTLPFFSRSMRNPEQDWHKVHRYLQHLKVTDEKFDISSCFTNQYLPEKPYSDTAPIACCI